MATARHPSTPRASLSPINSRTSRTRTLADQNDPLRTTTHLSINSSNAANSQPADAATHSDVDEAEQTRIERLGRERPAVFKTAWAEVGFCFSIFMSQMMAEYFISGFNVILPLLSLELDIPPASSIWPASAFTLVVASFLLVFGRIADMYGGYPVFVGGLVWFSIWSLIAGFSQNELMLDFCRALQGFGPAAFLPTGVMLIGSTYRPGPRKNFVFSIYGATAPCGFFFGTVLAGLTGSFTTWGWYFWIGSILVFVTAVTAFFTVPSDTEKRGSQGVKMDWLGAVSIVSGLILVVFAITDSAHAPDGWRSPYIVVTIVVGGLLLCGAVYIEGWVAEMPLLPSDVFHVPYIRPLLLALFFSYGCLGVFLLYATFYMQNVLGATPIQVAAWFVPMCLGGCIISTVGGLVLHVIPGTYILFVAGVAWVVAPLLFAIAPIGAGYWQYVFTSMIAATLGIDLVFNVANVFLTTGMTEERQGLAGALTHSILFLGISFFLGFADVTAAAVADQGERQSYKAALWFNVGTAGVALIIFVGFVRMDSAKSDLTADEKAALRVEAEAVNESKT
ncbi:MAG: hypothetical protein M1833_005728 [Piccolia ochrophora]|nr:MAG: hypothetical protein M1833_005728 [Piccolia ochrophora]